MKFILKNLTHPVSPAFSSTLKERVHSLSEVLRIDEAQILIERREKSSPAFKVAAHLVTPGPDVRAEAVDHTLRAALTKLFDALKSRIAWRRRKQSRRLSKGSRFSGTVSPLVPVRM